MILNLQNPRISIPYKIFYTMLHNQTKMVIVKTSQEEQNYQLCKNVLVTGQEEAVDDLMLGVYVDHQLLHYHSIISPCNTSTWYWFLFNYYVKL